MEWVRTCIVLNFINDLLDRLNKSNLGATLENISKHVRPLRVKTAINTHKHVLDAAKVR